jgi:hypothetical protein
VASHREVEPTDVYVDDLSGWMARVIQLQDSGHIPKENFVFGEDDDSRRFVAEVRRLNRGRNLNQATRVPVFKTRKLTTQVVTARPRERRPNRRRRVASSPRKTRGPDDPPDDLDELADAAWTAIGLESLGEASL